MTKLIIFVLSFSFSLYSIAQSSFGGSGGSNVSVFAVSGSGSSLVNTRTQSDLSTSMGASPLPAQRAALTPTSTSTYTDGNGYVFHYSIYAPTTTVGVLYPIMILDEIEPSSAPQTCTASTPNVAPALALPVFQATYPSYVVVMKLTGPYNTDPLCPTANNSGLGWKIYSAMAMKIIADTVIAANPTHIDPNRIYTAGFSAAGGIAWQALELYPTYFAAIATSSSPMVTLTDVPEVVVGRTAVYMTMGNAAFGETVGPSLQAPDKMWASAQVAGGNWTYVYNNALGHQLNFYANSVTWPDLTTVFNWMFVQHR